MKHLRSWRVRTAVPAIAVILLVVGAPAWAAPGNDSFSGATAVGALPFTDTTDSTGATLEGGEPSPSCAAGGAGGSLWYSFLAPQGTVEVRTFGSKFDTVLAVYTGTGPSDLTQVACNDDAQDVGSLQSRLQLLQPAGTVSFVQVTGLSGGAGKMVLTIEKAGVTSGTPGDDFAGAIEVTALPFTFVGNASDYTSEPNEPGPCLYYEPRRTIWFRFDAASDIGLDASVESDDYALLQIWNGASLDSLTPVACNEYTEDPSATARAGARVRPGETAYVQIDNYGSEFTVTIDQRAIAENDDFANAKDVTLPFEFDATTHGASVEAGEPEACWSPGPSIWYRFTASESVPVVLETQYLTYEYPFYPLAAVYEGESIDQLIEVACGYSAFMFVPSEGTTYYIQVAGFQNEVGAVEVTGARGIATSAGILVGGRARVSEDGRVGVGVGALVAGGSVDVDTHQGEGETPEARVCAYALLGTCVYL